MFEITCDKICIFCISFFHHNFIKDTIFRIRQFNFQLRRINVYTESLYFIYYRINNIFCEFEFRATENFPVLTNNILIQNRNDCSAESEFQNITWDRIPFQHSRNQYIGVNDRIINHTFTSFPSRGDLSIDFFQRHICDTVFFRNAAGFFHCFQTWIL